MAFWSEFYQDCVNVANVTIVCRDGLIKTHKLILANISEFSKNLIRDIPAADDVTLYLHEFTTHGVNLFLRDPDYSPELSTLFGKRDLLSSNLKIEENSIISTFKTEIFEDEDLGLDNLEPESLKFENPKLISIKQKSMVKRNGRDKKIEKETKKAKYEQAINAVKSGSFSSIRKAAQLYGVAASTLTELINENKSFKGMGRKSVYLSNEEEEAVVAKALELSEGGKKLTTDLFKDILVEEIRALMIKFPERCTALSHLESKLKQNSFYIHNLAKRHHVKLKAQRAIKIKEKFNDSDSVKKSEEQNRFEECEMLNQRNGLDIMSANEESKTLKTEEDHREDITKEEMEDSDDDNICDRDSEEVLDVEEYDRNVAETIRELEEEIIIEPTTEKQRRFNSKIETKIQMQRALADLKTGRVKSASAAAKMYGVPATTLCELRRKNKSFRGPGRRSKFLTEEEEKHIKSRILDLSNNGKYLTMDLVKRIVTEEYEILKVNFPERKPLEELQPKLKHFIYNFAARHNLKALCDLQLKEDRDTRRNFECEICQFSFTFKNSLVTHQRTKHSFLFT